MQRLQGVESWDAARTGRMLVYGALWLSPFLHVWYRALDGMVKGTGKLAVAQKIFIDQTCAATTNMVMFHAITSFLEGQSPAAVYERVKAKLLPTMVALWTIWPAVQLFNFTMVPLSKRVLVVNMVGVGWSMFLSYLGNSPEPFEEEAHIVPHEHEHLEAKIQAPVHDTEIPTGGKLAVEI